MPVIEVPIIEVNTDQQISNCYAAMKHLRPHLVEADFLAKIRRQYQQGYQIACIEVDGGVASLAGFRFVETMAWGNILYIDDLITHPSSLKKGYAGQLLDWLAELAKSRHCDEVHLDSGYQRSHAHRLYLNKGFQMVSHHFSKTISY